MEKSTVTQEFLDEFNNSELGKVLRLNNFKCSERTLQEVNRRLNKNYTMEILQLILCDSRNIIKDKSVNPNDYKEEINTEIIKVNNNIFSKVLNFLKKIFKK